MVKTNIFNQLNCVNRFRNCNKNNRLCITVYSVYNLIPIDGTISPSKMVCTEQNKFYQKLLDAIDNEHFITIRECSTKLLTSESEFENEANLLKSIAKRMCTDKHIDRV